MGMTSDDMYDWLYRLKSELVVYMPKEWHEPMRDSIQDAITFSRKYQMMQADYENRLKADMVAMLEEIESMFWELTKNKYDMQILYEKADNFEADFNSFIQQKINSLKEVKDGKDK